MAQTTVDTFLLAAFRPVDEFILIIAPLVGAGHVSFVTYGGPVRSPPVARHPIRRLIRRPARLTAESNVNQ